MISSHEVAEAITILGKIPISAYPGKSYDERSHNAVTVVDTLIEMSKTLRAFEERELRESAIAQPSGDEVEAVARAIMVAKGGKCLVEDWSIERRDNPHVALAWDQATAAITTYEAVSGVAKMRESLTLAIDLICGTHEYEPTHPVVAKIIAALGEKP